MQPAAPEPPQEAVREQLARILQSRGFVNSQRLQRFLSYVVEQSLSGQAQNLKEYSIALEVFDRSSEYNPRVDAVVRVEARRLRQKLDEYYETLGSNDPIRIEMPIGSYVPAFRQVVSLPTAVPTDNKGAVADEPPLPRRRSRMWTGVALAAFCVCVPILWWAFTRADRPTRPPQVVRLIRDAAVSREPAVSSDGKLVAYSSDQVGNFDIYVRRLDSGDTLQITRHEATESEPDISPDGSQVVFRSEREGGGIYLASIFGGNERLLVRDGRSPRFSPDGRSVAYWTGSLYFPTAQTYVLPLAEGGTPRRVGADLPDARNPIWAPDGKALLLQTAASQARHDFSIAALDGGPARPTGWAAAIEGAGLAGWRSRATWDGRHLYFSALTSPRTSREFTGVTQEAVNIWSIALNAADGRVSGEPRQVTFGASFEPESAITPSGDLLFTGTQYRFVAASAPLRQLSAPAEPVFSSAGSFIQPFVAAGGSSVVAVSDRSGQMEVWRKDLRTGEERALTNSPPTERAPILSADGSTLLFGVREPAYAMYQMKLGSSTPEKICADCGMLTDISSDGRLVVFEKGPPYVAAVLDRASGRSSTIANHPGGVYWARLSPDDKWIVFHAPLGGAHLALVVAPFRGETPIDHSAWIPVTRGDSAEWGPVWSPDTNTLYFMSDRDGSRCLWRMDLNVRSKKPSGPPTPVRHLHRGAAHIPMGVDPSAFRLSVAPERLFFAYIEAASSIYSAKLN